MSATRERGAIATFDCFGSTCAAHVRGRGSLGTAQEAVAAAQQRLLDGHRRFTRFELGSELSRLNADVRDAVPVSAEMARFVAAALVAARRSGGLVDATLLAQLLDAGYARDIATPVPLRFALGSAPARHPAQPDPAARWRELSVDRFARLVRRPAGLQLDSGGIVKGLLADLLGAELADHDGYAIDSAGDLRVGGRAGLLRDVRVASPFDETVLHTFRLRDGGVATSGIGRRSWLDANGAPAHHLLDPATGRPAFTGLVQATALAPSASEAEWRAKTALLSGPERAARWLPHGGLVVRDDGSHAVLVSLHDPAVPPPSGAAPSAEARASGAAPSDSQQLIQALAYVKAHGGGTPGVGSRQGASSARRSPVGTSATAPR
jgi:FAD:protein FMN transferase